MAHIQLYINRFGIISLFLFVQMGIIAQLHHEDERYIPETDPLVLDKLEQWQDKKFGLLMHWGAYSQWGIVESWSLSPEEYPWCTRTKGSDPDDYFTYKREYEALQLTFNPTRFDPDKWATAAKAAGMKYVVFTTKHHDGFTMFDSEYTDYKITDAKTPFHTNPKSNVTKEIFDSFRSQGFWAGAYFSKPDWHSEYYWDPQFPPKDRNVNYSPEENPGRWNNYVDFTHKQILEILSDYGDVDILWLDGGWVKKATKEEITEWYLKTLNNDNQAHLKHRMVNQDVKMDELVVKARQKQPGLIVVDRAVYGKNQNYLTPENRVPEKALPYPWESCIISGGGWAHTPGATYMTGREGIHTLVDIVSKGGNLLLNIAPGPDGTWQQGAYDLLQEYADWMDINAQAIYETRAIEPFKHENIAMTQDKEGRVNFMYMADEGEQHLPESVYIPSFKLTSQSQVTLLGSDNTTLKLSQKGDGFVIHIPEEIQNNPPGKYVWTFQVSEIDRG